MVKISNHRRIFCFIGIAIILLAVSALHGAEKGKWWEVLPRSIWKEFPIVQQSQPWFEVHLMQPGVYAIYEPGQWEEVISYLILGSRKALLFDTGLGIGDMKKLVSELTPLPVTVLNSHSHYDHVGGNYQFKDICAATTDFTLHNAHGSEHEEVKQFVTGDWIWKPTPSGFSADQYVIHPYTVTCKVTDGQTLDLGGRQLEVLITPGHAPDAICLLDRKNRTLFTGDSLYPAPLYAYFPESDLQQYASSAARLAKLVKDVDVLHPSHNQPVMPPDSLQQMSAAFDEILAGAAKYQVKDGAREYRFERFWILTKN